MVVEGWIHDFALDEAIILFNAGEYSQIVCTGVQIETGSYIQQFESYPEMTAARLIKMGVDPEKIIVSVADDAKKDRTYQAAVALREAFIAYNMQETDLHLITTGPHGRRSRMLFQKALGSDYNIGITCLAPASYEPKDWYKGSEGVRYVMSETLAYIYAKLFFHP
ncbi:YdcF family protein [Pontiellaceae bacterium B1224]|nr:YdcF family protein [Pontiellaceae bacterium B1224]